MLRLIFIVVLSGCPLTVVEPHTTYVLDPGNSELYAVLSPNQTAPFWIPHRTLIEARRLEGTVRTGADPTDCEVRIRIPIQSLEVDPPRLRRRLSWSEGPDDVSRARSREILLGKSLLDAAHHGQIVFRGHRCKVGSDGLVEGELEVRGRGRAQFVGADVALTDRRLTAVGRFEIGHENFGIVPYQDALGLTGYADQIGVVFSLSFSRLE